MRKILNHFIHCTAGFSGIPDIERFWSNTLKWKGKGYNYIIETNGTIWWLVNGKYQKEYDESTWETIVNGVQGFNNVSVSGAYIGGVERVGNVWKAKDTRTDEQKAGFLIAIGHWVEWMKSQKQDLSACIIAGHRDASKDSNGNNLIEPWERIKECPSFDAIKEYQWILKTAENNQKLPTR